MTWNTSSRWMWNGGTARLDRARGQIDLALSPSVRPAAAQFGVSQHLIEHGENRILNPRIGNLDTGFLRTWGTESLLAAIDGDGPLDQAHFLRVVTTVNHAGEGCVYGVAGQLGVTAGTPQTASMYVRGSGTVRAHISFVAGGGSVSGPAHTLGGEWERLSVTATPTVNTVAFAVVETTSAQVATIESGAWQFEASPHATAYLDGSMGAGFSWLGAPDQSPSQRQAGRISLPAITSPVRGGVALWWRPDHAYNFTRDRVLLHVPTGGAALQLRHIVATNRFRLSSPAGDIVEVNAPSFAAGDDLLVSAGWTRGGLSVGVGEAVVDATRTAGPWVASGRTDLGSTGESLPSAGLHADGVIGPAWWFDGAPPIETLRVLARATSLPRLAVA